MCSPNDDKQKYAYCKLKLRVEMFEHSTNQILRVQNVVIPTNKKLYFEMLG